MQVNKLMNKMISSDVDCCRKIEFSPVMKCVHLGRKQLVHSDLPKAL